MVLNEAGKIAEEEWRKSAAIRNYIRFNPQNYDVVMNVGEPQFLGDRALLERPKVGFLSSRGADAPHGRLPVKFGKAIISGFLSPMERAGFNAGLEYKKPLAHHLALCRSFAVK